MESESHLLGEREGADVRWFETVVHEEKRDRRRNQRDAESAGAGSC
jgi:hypothetical protein